MSGSKSRNQFRRRFSLQPSFMHKNDDEERPSRHKSKTDSTEEESKSNSNVRYKIVVMGAAKVGKSSIISQFLYSKFSSKYKRTIEEMHHGDFNVQGVHLTLDILDTAGSYEFPAMRALSISSADAFILVYDVNKVDTFEEARIIRDQIHETKSSTDVPIVVVGNKIDQDGPREVDTATTESVVTVDWENGFVETSAKDNLNVSQVFKELLVQAKVKYNLSPALRRRRRQSLPIGPGLSPGAHHPASVSPASSQVIPNATQLQHLQQLRDRHVSGSKRNSCSIS